MNIGKLHFIKAGEVIETGLITDQIFPWLKTKDLVHEVLGNCTKLFDLIPVVGANSIFLPLNGPRGMIRDLFFIFLTERRASTGAASDRLHAPVMSPFP